MCIRDRLIFDLSAAFDLFNHRIFLHRLEFCFGETERGKLNSSKSLKNVLQGDRKARKASAGIACNKMRKKWTSKLPRETKIRLFRASVESVLLYGSQTWT